MLRRLAERSREKLDPSVLRATHNDLVTSRRPRLHDELHVALSPLSLSPAETYPPGRRERPRSVTGCFLRPVSFLPIWDAWRWKHQAAPLLHRALLPSTPTASSRVNDLSKRKGENFTRVSERGGNIPSLHQLNISISELRYDLFFFNLRKSGLAKIEGYNN